MKKNLLIICGGQSSEHEISFRSAKNIYSLIDSSSYDIHIMAISRTGVCYQLSHDFFLQALSCQDISSLHQKPCGLLKQTNQAVLFLQESLPTGAIPIDMVFPVLHGPYGEDGTLQGWLEMLGVPYVGCGVLSSALSMDKAISKILFSLHQLPILPYCCLRIGQDIPSYDTLCQDWEAKTLFVKPASLGSSVGVARVTSQKDLEEKVADAFRYNTKILIEKSFSGWEVECSVLGNAEPQVASIMGKIICKDFYSYEVKYLDVPGAIFEVPANIPTDQKEQIAQLALKAYRFLECSGLARIDFFVNEKDIFINEINTMPGFTSISLYPRLWQLSGTSEKDLVSQLIALAEQRFLEKISQENVCPMPLKHL